MTDIDSLPSLVRVRACPCVCVCVCMRMPCAYRHAAQLHLAVAGGEEAQPEEQSLVAQTGRLFVRNLPYTATAAELGEVFQEHGELTEVHLLSDK